MYFKQSSTLLAFSMIVLFSCTALQSAAQDKNTKKKEEQKPVIVTPANVTPAAKVQKASKATKGGAKSSDIQAVSKTEGGETKIVTPVKAKAEEQEILEPTKK